MDINIRICGAAGQGVQSLGDLLVHTFAAMRLHVFATQSYLSRIRGGVNCFDIRIGQEELFSSVETVDLLIALTAESYEQQRKYLSANGMIIYNTSETGDRYFALDMEEQAREAGGSDRMLNSVAAGAALGILDYSIEPLFKNLETEFKKKSDEVVEQNHKAAQRGFEAVAEHRGLVRGPKPSGAPATIYSGSQAIALSAAVAGVKIVFSYPMTPSTGVLTELADMAHKYRILVEQAEDEIAAPNLLCGATYAGVPAMTTTSGGGFALMTEGLSLAGTMELPIVIFLSMRPGPATGMPTRTAQGDLQFAVFSGHGEFPKVVLAPGSISQCYTMTRRAFEFAHKYQTPAILIGDQYITDLQKNVDELPADPDPVDRRLATDVPEGASYKRYQVTDSGISPRALPGGSAFVVSCSDMHDESGRLSEDFDVQVALHDKRMSKARGILDEFIDPEVYPEPASEILLCWGSTREPCRAAVDTLRKQGRDICMIHFSMVWPLDGNKLRALFDNRKVTAVEGNVTGQFASLMKMAGALDAFTVLPRYDGLHFTEAFIVKGVS